ncbi:MAG TPA: hypothetical protein VHD60_02460 [Candidatus Saccharimonadales bacterium]|nr:hypothetical protein [Candidatus Saccharimonadales bacterium]
MSDAFRAELARQAVMPPANDARIAAFSQACLQAIERPEMVTLEAELDKRTDLMPSYAANLLLRSMQKQLLRTDPTYPFAHTLESAWHESFERLWGDTGTPDELLADIRGRNVQSNVVERYKAFKLVASLLHERLGEEITLMDVGASRNHGLKKLKLDLPFKPVECGVRDHPRFPAALLDTLANGALKQPMKLGHCVGTDVIPLKDGDDAFWAKSCSFYPSELLDEAAIAEYDYLDLTDVHGVSFVEGDFTGAGLCSPAAGYEKFDVITASTFLYQLSASKRAHARQLFHGYIAEKGVIIYQDFVRQSSNKRELDFEKNWFAALFPYRTLVEFADDSSGRVYEVLRWSNGRCNLWVPGKDIDKVITS